MNINIIINNQRDTCCVYLPKEKLASFEKHIDTLFLLANDASLEAHVFCIDDGQETAVISRLAADILGVEEGQEAILTTEINFFDQIEKLQRLAENPLIPLHHPVWTRSLECIRFLNRNIDELLREPEALYKALTRFSDSMQKTDEFKEFLQHVKKNNPFERNPELIFEFLERAMQESEPDGIYGPFACIMHHAVIPCKLVKKTNSQGETPLHLACKHQDSLLIDILSDNGADKHARTTTGQTPLHYFAKYLQLTSRIPDTLDYKTIHCDNNGQNPLHVAFKAGNFNAVKLFDKRVLTMLDNEYKTPMTLAIENDFHAKLLDWINCGIIPELTRYYH